MATGVATGVATGMATGVGCISSIDGVAWCERVRDWCRQHMQPMMPLTPPTTAAMSKPMMSSPHARPDARLRQLEPVSPGGAGGMQP